MSVKTFILKMISEILKSFKAQFMDGLIVINFSNYVKKVMKIYCTLKMYKKCKKRI